MERQSALPSKGAADKHMSIQRSGAIVASLTRDLLVAQHEKLLWFTLCCSWKSCSLAALAEL
jgi:hypothetical protein